MAWNTNRIFSESLYLHADGDRLNLGNFGENGLNCDNWNWDENRNDNLGCFPPMVCRRSHKRPGYWPFVLFTGRAY